MHQVDPAAAYQLAERAHDRRRRAAAGTRRFDVLQAELRDPLDERPGLAEDDHLVATVLQRASEIERAELTPADLEDVRVQDELHGGYRSVAGALRGLVVRRTTERGTRSPGTSASRSV